MVVELELGCVNSSILGATLVPTGDPVDCIGVETVNVVTRVMWLVMG